MDAMQGYGPPPGGQNPYGPPPGPYAQQPYPMQPYGAPPQPMMMGGMGGGTCFGVPLAPGERVIYFTKLDYTLAMVLMVVFGVLLLVVIVGIALILIGALMPLYKDRAVFVTNQRVVLVKANRQPRWVDLGAIKLVTARRRYYRGGGIVGGVVAVALTAAAEMNKPWDPSYWMNARGVTIATYDNQRLDIGMYNAAPLGMMLARILAAPGSQEQYPNVQYPTAG